MTTTTIRRAAKTTAVIVAVIVACLLATGCGPKSGTASPGASSASAKAHAEATSSGGQAVKQTAAQLAAACKAKLGAQGYNAMAPGVPGAKAARKTFEGCEKIPRAKVFAWLVCLGKAYGHAPKGGAPGTPAADARQSFLAAAFGGCTKTARGTT